MDRSEQQPENIVILGAGYAGIEAAKKLSAQLHGRKDYQIVLVNKHDYHMLMTQIYEHAAGLSNYAKMMIPLADVFADDNIKFVKGSVDHIDVKNKCVQINHGEVVLRYKYLVLALGSDPEYYSIEGLQENSVSLSCLNKARRIRCEVEALLEKTAAAPAERRQKLTFVVGGGGLTGVEFAGELACQLQKVTEKYNISPEDYRIILIEAGPTLLPGMAPKVARYAKKALERQGVEVITGDLVKRVVSKRIYLASGREIDYSLLVWSGGVRGNSLLAESGLRVNPRGRLLVNEYLQCVDDPCIYGAGDSALVIDTRSGRPMIPTAQASRQHGRYAAQAIYADITGRKKKPFRAKGIVLIVNVGRRYALADAGRFAFTGPLAVLIKAIIPVKYALQLGGIKMLLQNFFRARNKKSELFRTDDCQKAAAK